MNNSTALQIPGEFCQRAMELLDQAELKTGHCLGQLSDNQIWWRPESSMNSVGNLIRHMTGNLTQWGVVSLTGQKDERDRQLEFAASGSLSRIELIDQMAQSTSKAKQLWGQLDPGRLAESLIIQGFEVSIIQAIMHTASHFVGHTHQVVLLTRLQLGSDYKFQWTPESERGTLPI